MAETYEYEKLVNGKRETVGQYTIDHDGSITGRIVVNVKAWFDENPEERKRLGWIKHIHPDREELGCNPQTHYIITSVRQVDEYTIIDEYRALPKTEEMLALEELMDSIGAYYDNQDDEVHYVDGLRFFWGGII